MEAVQAISAQPPLKDIATLAQEIAVDAGDQGLSYREILLRAEGRGYAPFILFAAVLLLAPIDIVLHQVAAATLLVCGMGVFFRKPAPWMPKFLANQKAKRDDLDGLVTALKGVQSFTHLVVSPRHPEFSFGVGEKAAGLSLILLAFAVATALPDSAPALAAIALGLGLLQRDGLVMMIGAATAFGWAAFLATMIFGLATGAPFAGGWAHDNAAWLADALGPRTP